ncbi:acyltransferase [Photobacterium sp. WH77]|uniref:acyltransferase family protein n=1 Tax=unclassified Photobacterium TaxID=2628852 RepID=UPI001C44FB71|nr:MULTISPECIES: acyltransferase [unclassified Photobacterium]MBV7263430.1 acyltransferase [Photobacterium sp. WH24]MCG2838092.1 acyltransferase [Photobacterium sp. WH77]MCG2845710.1 acyltransferase [Photobacterium sp. WH80]
MQRQLPLLTPIRGIAALIVTYFHARLILFPQWRDSIAESTHFLENGYLWVDIFFILSGFVMMYVYQSTFATGSSLKKWRGFMWLRFSRIYPLFFVTLAALFIWEYYKSIHQIGFYAGPLFDAWGATGIPPFSGPFNRTETLVPNLFLVNGILSQPLSWNIAGWSLSIEWLCYLVFPLLMSVLLRPAKSNAWLPVLIMMVLGGMVSMHGTLDITSTLNAFVRGICGFTLGMWLSRISFSPRMKSWVNHDGLLIALIIALISVLQFSISYTVTMTTYVLFALLVLVAANQQNRSSLLLGLLDNKVTQFLGDISYSIYLWHSVLLLAGVEILHHINPDWTAWWYAQTSATTVLTGIFIFTAVLIIVSVCSYYLFERPLMKWMRGMGGKRTTPEVSKA